MRTIRGRVGLTCLAAALVAASGGWPPSAVAGALDPGSPCLKYPEAADGTRRQSFDEVEVTNQLAGTPPRIETSLRRGQSGSYCVGFHNRTGKTLDLALDVSSVDADKDGSPVVGVEDAAFGAGSWLDPVTDRIVDLPHGDLAWIRIDASVPADAVTGSSYASITAVEAGDESGAAADSGSRVTPISSVAIQLFFDVPGNADIAGRFVGARAPRVIWWDGLDVARLGFLEDLRGLGVATVRYAWRNDGNLTDTVQGRVIIESDLGGRKVADLQLPEMVVLRGSTRHFEATWSRDIPFIGRFTPTIEVTDSTGTVHRRKLDPIWVIPSWWYLLALALALGIPVWSKLRSRRRYRALLERVEAAEGRRVEEDGDDEYDLQDDGRW